MTSLFTIFDSIATKKLSNEKNLTISKKLFIFVKLYLRMKKENYYKMLNLNWWWWNDKEHPSMIH